MQKRILTLQGALKNPIVAWSLFDWANSSFSTIIITFVFATYFTTQIASDKIIGTMQWGYAITIAGIIVALLSPILGAIADYNGKRKRWLLVFTYLSIVATSLLWFAKPFPDYVLMTLGYVIIATVGFEFSMVFYNAMLPEIAPKTHIGRVSGWAWGIGYAGGLVSLIICLFVFVYDKPAWLDPEMAEHIRICAPFVGIWFALFSLPLFLYIPDSSQQRLPYRLAIKEGLLIWKRLHSLVDNKNILLFLIARMLYTNGLNSIFIFGGIYAAGSFHMSIAEVMQFGIAMNITAGLGAILFAWLDDFIGARYTIFISLISLTAIVIILLLISSKILFWCFALLLGCFVGPAQAASRSLMARLAPEKSRNEMFGLYAFSGKVTAYLGPWLLSTVTFITASQRWGMATILLFLASGAFLLWFVRDMPQDVIRD